jgi:hypothetical protein
MFEVAVQRFAGSALAALSLLVVGIAGVAAPDAGAAKKKRDLPTISIALASYEETEGRVGIAVKVQSADEVSVTYGGVRENATKVTATNFWWNASFDGGLQNCYRITVRARNGEGTVERGTGAGLLGTEGCADCSGAEAKVAEWRHKVKHAKKVLRRADSKSETRVAKRRLARAKDRLQRAQATLEACLG